MEPVSTQTARGMTDQSKTHFEVIVIGAGVAGIYQIHRLASLGIDATVLDSAPDLGGTWYWNRYPGARFDSESYTYGYSFSKDCLLYTSPSPRDRTRSRMPSSA